MRLLGLDEGLEKVSERWRIQLTSIYMLIGLLQQSIVADTDCLKEHVQ